MLVASSSEGTSSASSSTNSKQAPCLHTHSILAPICLQLTQAAPLHVTTAHTGEVVAQRGWKEAVDAAVDRLAQVLLVARHQGFISPLHEAAAKEERALLAALPSRPLLAILLRA